jgi:hypothetical protein
MYFLPYTSGTETLESVGRGYVRYRRIMERWQGLLRLPVLTVGYEELVAEPERTVRALLDFCGLDWHDACLQFHRTERFAGTFSYHQVRKPLYTRSVGRHRNYEKHLGPLRAALGGYVRG